MDVRSNSIVVRRKRSVEVPVLELGIGETGGIGGNRRVLTQSDRVERDGGPGLDHVNRRIDARYAVYLYFTAAETHVGMVHVIQKDPLSLAHAALRKPAGRVVGLDFVVIQFVTEDQPPPISFLGSIVGRILIGVVDRFVVQRSKDDAVLRRPQDLQSPTAAILVQGRTPHVDIGFTKL